MIEHIVLFQFQPDTSPEAIAAMMQGLKGLEHKIPGIVSLSCGENFSDRAREFTHGLVIRFVDRAALEAYQPHPEHQEVVNKLIKPILANILAMDYHLL